MRTALLTIAVAAIMATVWFYAASSTSDNRTADGIETGEVNTVSATPVIVAWVYTGDFVTEVKVTWTPKAAASYNLVVTVGGNTETFTTATTKANFTRTDSVKLPPTDPSVITSATVVIEPN